jgi:acetyltransferase-like isoleucine patch superfamily enzyme
MAVLTTCVQVCRRLRARLRGVNLGSARYLGESIDWHRGGTQTGQLGTITIGAQVSVEQGVVLHAFGGSIRLGKNVFLGPHTVIYGHGGVDIGDSTLIAMHCRIVSSNHTIPAMGTDIRSQPDELRPTKIGRDVWLGAGVTVLGGVTIGDSCIIGAGAVVTKDIPPGAICIGSPAQVVRWRPGASQPT